MADSPRTSEFTTTVTSTHKCDLQPTEGISSVGIREQKGEVSEWLKEHAWKVCVGLYPTEGSNPSLTAIILETRSLGRVFYCLTIVVVAKGGEGGIRTLHFLAWAIISKTRSLGRVFYCLKIMVVAKGGEGGIRTLHFLARTNISKTRFPL